LVYSVLPFPVFVTLPSRPPSRFRPIAPSLPLFSAPSVTSVLISPRHDFSQLYRPTMQPHTFPLFPHPVNMAHTQKPANSYPSIVYFTLLCIPGKIDAAAPMPPPFAPSRLVINVSPLSATFTKNTGAPLSPSRTSNYSYSLPTTHSPHHFATLFLAGTNS
jgi:hypothetical protein